jgi:hypothetical protein
MVAASWSGETSTASHPGRPVVRPLAPQPAEDGDRPAAWPGGPTAFVRPRAITLLAVLDLVTAFVLLAIGGLAVYASTLNSGDDRAFLAAMAVACVLIGFGHLFAGMGLFGMKGWGRVAQIALSCVNLLSIPVGTIMGGLQLAWLFRSGARTLFSGRRPQDLPEDEREEAERAARETGLVTASAWIGLVLVGCAGAGIGAAIAIPSLLVARVSTNEAAAIADLQSVVAAQEAYRSANGHYDRLECLAVPSACIPAYPATGPVFLDGRFVASVERSGYRFHLEGGPSPVNLSIARSSASSMDRYAYLASPARFRTTGRRVFCADDTGRVCAFKDLAVRRLDDGRCSADCIDLP